MKYHQLHMLEYIQDQNILTCETIYSKPADLLLGAWIGSLDGDMIVNNGDTELGFESGIIMIATLVSV